MFLLSKKYISIFLLILILLVAYRAPLIKAEDEESAWLKVVTPSWKGQAGSPYSPLVDPAFTGAAERFNVTNALVELYTNMPAAGGQITLGTFHTNGTGFVQIKWPTTYGGFEVKNFTLFIHWKDTGIYIYNLTVRVGKTGLTNNTITWDGNPHLGVGNWPWTTSGLETSVQELMNTTDLTAFASQFSSPDKAFVAHAAIIFKDIKTFYTDKTTPLGNTVIRVYENFITDQSSTESLIYAGTADENGLLESVPIPLNLTGSGLAYPNLNGSIAVWWETVLVGFVNHTLLSLPFDYTMNKTTNKINCTVYNSTFGVQDNATTKQPLWGARIKVNVLPTNYLMHVWYLTNASGNATVILPNSTNGLRYCYNPNDMVVIDTATFADDVEFSGLGIEVEWEGGIKNAYGGSWVLVNYTFLDATDPKLIPSNFWESIPADRWAEVNVTTSVYDVAFKVVDALGTPVDGAFVTVYRQNGPPVTKESGKITDFDLDQDIPLWYYEPGCVFFHQLPGKLLRYGTFPAIYGVKVVYEGVEVYSNATVLKPLNWTINNLPKVTIDNWLHGSKQFPYIVLNASIFKIEVKISSVEKDIQPNILVRNNITKEIIKKEIASVNNNFKATFILNISSFIIEVDKTLSLGRDRRVIFKEWRENDRTVSKENNFTITFRNFTSCNITAIYETEFFISFTFKDSKGKILTPDPTYMVINNTILPLPYNEWLNKGIWKIERIIWKGINVPSENETININSPGEKKILCKIYDLKIIIKDPLNLTSIKNVEVSIASINEKSKTDSNGVAIFSIPTGEYQIDISYNLPLFNIPLIKSEKIKIMKDETKYILIPSLTPLYIVLIFISSLIVGIVILRKIRRRKYEHWETVEINF